ncbi:hypothetical protein Hanom_Chr04g00366911 [Helianthus anomalus]
MNKAFEVSVLSLSITSLVSSCLTSGILPPGEAAYADAVSVTTSQSAPRGVFTCASSFSAMT